MKMPIIILVFLSLLSCNGEQHEKKYEGKWAALMGSDYVEYHIINDTIYRYTAEMTNIFPITFSEEKDSLFYHIYQERLGYRIIGDTIMILQNDRMSDTLYKMDNSIVTYDEINPFDSLAIKKHGKDFFSRANAIVKKHGYSDFIEFWEQNCEIQ